MIAVTHPAPVAKLRKSKNSTAGLSLLKAQFSAGRHARPENRPDSAHFGARWAASRAKVDGTSRHRRLAANVLDGKAACIEGLDVLVHDVDERHVVAGLDEIRPGDAADGARADDGQLHGGALSC